MFNEKVLAKSLRLMFSSGLMLSLGMAAQFAQAQAQDDKVQRVEVTGSNIKRSQSEGASPIQVMNRDEIEKTGKVSVAEVLQSLAIDGSGSLNTSFGSGFAAGATTISLRGLGSNSTLILLNGRRMAQYGRSDDGRKAVTDLSSVPAALIERIEILKDGASSVYGADAVAGVVNVILRKDYQGIEVKGTTGISGYRDGKDNVASITAGFGNLDTDKYNLILNAEVSKTDGISSKDRVDRDWISQGDIRKYGYGMVMARFVGGYIVGNNNASASPTGNIRDPKTLNYTPLPGCAKLSPVTNQDPNGGCLWYDSQFRSMTPDLRSTNLFTRGTWQLNDNWQVFAEASYMERKTSFTLTPPSVTPTVAFPPNASTPTGVIAYGNLPLMGATHPQNPFGAATRLRYVAFDVGPSVRNAENSFDRFMVGAKGSAWGWDMEAGLLHSTSKLRLDYTNMLNMKVLQAALGDPKSQYFPYYIGEQAYKNPKALYDAMVMHGIADASTKLDVIDFKASRELMPLAGGNMALAVGFEHRKESVNTPSLSGSEDGTINSSYVASFGDTKVTAAYAELLAPILKELELSGALRYDKYDNFSSTTPKLGIKWSPMKNLALRGTYTEGFRAPGAAESGARSQSTGSASATDPIRCPGGKALPGATAADCASSFGGSRVGNPNLQPEKSKGYTLGIVWDPLPNTGIAIDFWRIKRDNEINVTPYAEAAAFPDAIRSDNNLVIDGKVVPNSGTLLLVKAPFRNANYTQVSGVDVDIKQRFNLGEQGKLTAGLNWTHMSEWKRVENNGNVYNFAGTHGDCDASNCVGTPKDKVNFNLTWAKDSWSVTGLVNYRGEMKNITWEGQPCFNKLANGSPAPNADCTIKAFTTLDLSAKWDITKQLQVFGSIQNVTDAVAPLDPQTYGAIAYNPMDVSGAIGRYFRVGVRYKFK